MEIPTAKQNPFSLYDFIGYFIPGFYIVFLLLFVDVTFNNHQNISSIDKFYSSVVGEKFSNDVVEETSKGMKNQIEEKTTIKNYGLPHYLFFIVPAVIIFFYIIGHLISLMSNLIIEEFPSVKVFRRPYKVLLKILILEKENFWTCVLNIAIYTFYVCSFNILSWEEVKKNFYLIPRIVINAVFWILPLGAPSALFILFFPPLMTEEDISNKLPIINNFYKVQPLGDPDSAREKVKIILKKYINQENLDNSFNYLMNIVLKECPSHVWKIQNYVALYGFMRNMLMANIFIFYITIFIYIKNAGFSELLFLLFILFMNVIFFYGYLKYVRRYTEEVIFAACAIDEKEKS